MLRATSRPCRSSCAPPRDARLTGHCQEVVLAPGKGKQELTPGDLHGGPFGRRDRAPAVGGAPALARTRPMHPRDRPSIKSNSSLVTFIGFYLFSALSGHGGLASSRRWSDGPYGKHHHPLGLSGGHAGCDVLSYSPSALETLGGEPRSLSEPPEPLWRKTVKWSRPTAEEVCGGRNRPARRCRCTRVSGWDVQSRRAVVRRAFLPRAISSASAHRPRGGKRGMSGHATVGDFRSESHGHTLVRASS